MCKLACYDLLNTHLATMQVAEHTRMQIYEAIADHFSNKQLLPLTAKLFNLNFHPLEVVSR